MAYFILSFFFLTKNKKKQQHFLYCIFITYNTMFKSYMGESYENLNSVT